ncbi:aldo-keto reductase family 1 member B1-like isoform X2 [Phymastichus coffea]|uniref:aldo-keto reductase family 1 member B1-like isoform X2 n=1 Tax=Phymastichus coffea TaxID=108790 RepID=UPI00273C281B|nr:aldo-keto reductase family 1 member B1-like isoform X2 [Phymastichus coffea]
MSELQFATFYNGYEIPVLGLGTWQSVGDSVVDLIKDAVRMGYRHIDTAQVYGNEKEIGQAITDLIEEGIITREEIFVTSKLSSTRHRSDLVEPALRQTLSDLNIEYLDLYLIHWPMAFKESENPVPMDTDGKIQFSDVDYLETWEAMEQMQETGLTKNIGVSNFNSTQLSRVLDNCKIKPVTNQVECHPYLPQIKLSEFCKSKDILITAYSPLGAPKRPWMQEGEPVLLEDPKITEIAEKYEKSTAQVVLRYQIQRGHIVIPKTISLDRLEENMQIFDFELSEYDIESLHTFERNRFCPFTVSIDHKDYPFHDEF